MPKNVDTPAIEIVTLPMGPELKADIQQLLPTAHDLLKQPGCKKISYGVLIEEPDTLILFIEWDRLQDHYNFIAAPNYMELLTPLVKLLSGPVKFIHVPFVPFPPGKALDGPIVELTHFNGNADTREELVTVTKEILDLADKHPKCTGTAWAPSVEDENQLVLLLSWPTVEAHMEDYREQAAFQPLAARVGKVVNSLSIVHMKIVHLN